MPVGDVRFEEQVFALQIWRPSGRAHGLVRLSAWVEYRNLLVGRCCVTGFPIEESRPLNLDKCVSRGYSCAVPSAPPFEEEEELLELGNDVVQLLPPLSVIDGKDPVPPDGSNALRSLLIGFLGGVVAVATVLVGNANG
ncbi:hypothetical protein IFM89_034606 [Coptis chinensis]|uniref:Uncharacterized protein n=1 Tax=Coptis chinensis TaxID=261450 RepID=A0A835HS67_9MAGN|nr:hypothetical protein IFM89_034606 [Coptis chinensis]